MSIRAGANKTWRILIPILMQTCPMNGRYPTGHNYDYVADAIAVDTFSLSRSQYGFCGSAGRDANCTLYIAVSSTRRQCGLEG